MKKIILYLIFIIISVNLFSQNKYWVVFKNKKTTFNPYKYFDKKAITRRLKNNISLYDSTDFPINKKYKLIVNNIVDSITSETRWFNALAVYADKSEINKIKKLPFVKYIRPITLSTYIAEYDYDTTLTYNKEQLRTMQLQEMGGEYFAKKNITGKGVRIAIFDGGFPTVDVNPAFEHVRKNNRIIKTYDFTKKRKNVYYSISHGTMVMSNICGIVNGKKLGLATDAEFLLAKTEIKTEPFSEEENWLAAVEWADKNGADIINSSLGYTKQRYFPWDMNGTSFVAQAANLAARKGILVVNAAGNEGDTRSWKHLGTPADADSALSVGGINPETNTHISFSSYGPTADKRLKPNVCAFGKAVVSGKNKLKIEYGTSFASPLVAGFAACAKQTRPDITNMQLFNEIEQSANLYPYYDYAHGYGVPQAKYFTDNLRNSTSEKNFEFIDNYTSINIKIINDKNNGQNILYYKIQNDNGIIDEYWAVKIKKNQSVTIPKKNKYKGKTLIAHYNGYNNSIKIKQ